MPEKEKADKQELLARNHIDLEGPVNEQMFMHVRDSLMYLSIRGSPDIFITITSHGGDAMAARSIVDLLHIYAGKITGLVIGGAGSAAATILQGCDIRLALSSSVISPHKMNTKLTIDVTDKTIEQITAEVRSCMENTLRLQANTYELFARRCNKSVEAIKALFEIDGNLIADRAKEFGLIDDIVSNLDDLYKITRGKEK